MRVLTAAWVNTLILYFTLLNAEFPVRFLSRIFLAILYSFPIKPTETDNDKYAFRCFLLRLGFIGKRTPDFETLIRLSDLFDVRTDYILGKSNDSSSAKLSDDDIEQLGRWELESVYTDLMKLYLSLDSFGQKDVENLIKSEAQLCKEQNTLQDVSNMAVQITIKK